MWLVVELREEEEEEEVVVEGEGWLPPPPFCGGWGKEAGREGGRG